MKKLLIILMCLVLILLSGCKPKPPPPPDEVVYRALLVGVGDYMYVDRMDLTSPPFNVDRLKVIFNKCKFGEKEIPFKVINELKDHDATKEAILNGVLTTFGEADEDDISYFYFMGHGGVKDGHPIFCPTDYDRSLEFDITLTELETVFDQIEGTKILFLESCHSGNFIEKAKESVYFSNFNRKIIDTFRKKRAFNKGNYKVMTSCKGEQICWACGTFSWFTMGIYKGCRHLGADYNHNGVIDLSELYKYTVKWVKENTTKKQDAQMYPENSTFPIVEY